ncbi:serine/threonine-protein kinase STE20-like [Prosopis cineraria]|uniref:serine/threonine-protein kinase STE20-like n=1 Tax=Prosopis cineraria TaxID=364024 RepID=UPI0024101987|nr:serine/threonine-protein kinase STE20-like [Prosopis cineraria]
MMEQLGMQKQQQYNTMEPQNEELHSAPQSTFQDRLEGMRINMRPADRNMSDKKPVLNYSIQTGEEFALEFMRDRVNLGQPVFPNIMGDPNYATGYMELKGILGISHSGSESGSDISMLPKVEKVPKEFDRRGSSMQRDRSNYGSVRSIPRTSSNQENNRVLHGLASSGASNRSSMKMKVLCSFGGRILPRPSDGKLRYVGGETRIICIRKDISWQELMQKALSLYNETHLIKYQLPGEDLDALVSVSSDEDLRNMMEECHDLENREGSQKLRMFLFSTVDMDDPSVDGDTEVQYVVAVNGMDLGSRNHSVLHVVSASTDNLHELDGQNIEREASRAQIESTGAASSSLAADANSSLGIQFSQPMIPTASSAYESNLLFHSSQQGDTSQYPVHYGVDSSNNLAFRQIPVSAPTHVPGNQGIINEGHPDVLQVQNSEMPAMMVKKRGDSSIKHESDSGKGLSSETPYPVPTQPFDGNLPGNISEVSVTNAVQGVHLPKLPSKSKGKHQHYEEASSLANAVNSTQILKSGEDDLYSTSTNAFNPSYVNAGSNVIDLSCLEPPALPNRVYYSERIPREQADLLNRSTKSDDAHGSQVLMADLLSGYDQQSLTTESSDQFQVGNLSNLTAVSSTTAKPLNTNGHAIGNGLAQLQNHKQLPDANVTDTKVAANEDWVLRSENETNLSKDNHNNHLVDETNSTEHPAFHKVPSDHNLGDASDKESSNDAKVQLQPFSLTGNVSQDVSQGLLSDAVSTPAQGDIMIDIDDRFPRDYLYDMFSKAILSEDSSRVSPLPTDGTGLSLNVENHEPKSWSYFQKLANEGFDNVSLIDQDHLGFSSTLRKVQEGDSRSQQVAPLPADGVSVGHDFGEENQKKLLVTTGRTEATVLHPNYDQTQVTETENKNLDPAKGNTRVKDSEYEDVKNKTGNIGHPHDHSLDGIDISTLQLINNEDLEELKELGSGTFGTVYHGKWRGTDVAIKRIKKSCFTGRSSEQERLTVEFWREADILSKLHHPNVVAFYGVVQDGPGGTLATVTEFMVDGSLRHVLVRKDRYLDRRKRLIIAMDAAFGMEYLHSKNIVHFDLKCDNLLVNLKDPLRPICKVGDFGLSKIKRNTLVSGGVRGTLPWMAPELLNGSSNKVSEKVDVFSFGIVLWEILTGEEPYANMHYGAIIGGIVNNTLRPTIPSYCDPEWRQLMEQCWAPNPAARPSFTEIARRLRVMSAAASQTKGQGYKASK